MISTIRSRNLCTTTKENDERIDNGWESELLRLALTVTAIWGSRREFLAEIAHLPIGYYPMSIFQGQEDL